jgi:hypothetical protein
VGVDVGVVFLALQQSARGRRRPGGWRLMLRCAKKSIATAFEFGIERQAWFRSPLCGGRNLRENGGLANSFY